MKIEITISARDSSNGWDKEKVEKVIEFDVTPDKYYPIGDLVEALAQEATKERQAKLDAESAE